MGEAIFVVVVASLLGLGVAATLSRRDRWTWTLIALLALTATTFVTGVLIVSIRDLISSSDCVGTCIGEFEYDVLWGLAIYGGAAFALTLGAAFIRALVSRRGALRDTRSG